jgi:hypothetical protein
MSERPDNDVARDAKLTAVYRAAGRDTPPSALDAAILAAARREVGARPRPAGFSFARSWRGPLSAAAVIVLSVSLIMLMREEAPDLVAPPREDVPAAETKLKSPEGANENEATRARKSLQEPAPKSLGLKPSDSMPQSGLRQPEVSARSAPTAKDAIAGRSESAADGPAGPAKRRDAMAGMADARKNRAAAVPEPQRQAKTDADKEFAPTPAAAPPRVAEAAPEKVAPAIGTVAGTVEKKAAAKPALGSAGRSDADSAQRAQSADARAKQLADAAPPAAKAAPASRQIAPAAPATSLSKLERNVDLTPEKWLERIEELRKQGKLDEARTSLAEFRKRYPDYRLPESLRDGLRE